MSNWEEVGFLVMKNKLINTFWLPAGYFHIPLLMISLIIISQNWNLVRTGSGGSMAQQFASVPSPVRPIDSKPAPLRRQEMQLQFCFLWRYLRRITCGTTGQCSWPKFQSKLRYFLKLWRWDLVHTILTGEANHLKKIYVTSENLEIMILFWKSLKECLKSAKSGSKVCNFQKSWKR